MVETKIITMDNLTTLTAQDNVIVGYLRKFDGEFQNLKEQNQSIKEQNQVLYTKVANLADDLVRVEGKLNEVLANTIEVKGMVLAMFEGLTPKTKSQIEKAAEFALAHKEECLKAKKDYSKEAFKLTDVVKNYREEVLHSEVSALGIWLNGVLAKLFGTTLKGVYAPEVQPLASALSHYYLSERVENGRQF